MNSKKLISFFVHVLFLLSCFCVVLFGGCTSTPPSQAPSVFNSEDVLKQITITKYSYIPYSVKTYGLEKQGPLLEVENHSPFNISLFGEIQYFDENDMLIETWPSFEPRGIGAGQTIVWDYGGYCDFSYDHYDVVFRCTLEEEWVSMYNSLSYAITDTPEGFFFSATNNGEQALSSVRLSIVFFKDNEPVECYYIGMYETSFYTIAPGETAQSGPHSFPFEYDCYKVYPEAYIISQP